MIDLSRYRIIDLSVELLPGERLRDGRYLHGEPLHGRPIELQEFQAYGARMHHIQTQTHLGTHAESTYKYVDEGPDLADMPLESYLGEAVACNFTHKGPAEAITVEEFEAYGVSRGDIVLVWGAPHPPGELAYTTNEAIDWLIETGIKCFCFESVHYEPTGTPFGAGDSDCRLLMAGIPVIDSLQGMDQIKRERVFFIALPIRMHRVTASPTRAIALEEL